MPCFHPWRHKRWADRPSVTLACGQCIGCRMAKSVDWSTRIAHEAQMHDHNCFVTLTYAPEHLPADRSISVRDVQLFMKRLRKALGHSRVRFFACGEYGEAFGRPHYHLILFGWEPTDGTPWRRTPSGFVVHRSPFLESVWPYGHIEVGTVTTQSAAYVARYCTKKITGDLAREHYWRTETDAEGVVLWSGAVRPEFITMSTKPGIGAGWYERFSSDAFPSDFVTIDGGKRPVPRYYLRKLKASETWRESLSGSETVKSERIARAAKHADNNTPERLATREESQTLRASRLARDLEEPSS